MGFREFFGFNPSAIPEDHKAPTKAGNADDPTSRKSVEQFKTVNDVVDKGLSPEEQAIKNEEGVTEVLNEANQSDDKGLNAQGSYEEEVLARRRAEEEEGWSPKKKPGKFKADLKIAAKEAEIKFDKMADKENTEEAFKIDRFLSRTVRTEEYKNKRKPGQETVRGKAA